MAEHPTFCAALLNNIRINNDFSLSPCCVFKSKKRIMSIAEYVDHPHIRDIIHRVINGEKPEECRTCWFREDNGLKSLRQTYNHEYFPHGISEKLVKKLRNTPINVMAVDLKVSNVCNFACAMCKPSDSSRIQSLWNNNPNPEFTGRDDRVYEIPHKREFLEQVFDLFPKLTYLKVLGGEPLIDKTVMDILCNQPDKVKERINLNLVTNGSVDLTETAERLGDYRRINFSVSIEGIGPVQDFIRYGSDWSQIEKNLLSFKQTDKHILTLLHVYQALNYERLGELETWAKNNNIQIIVNHLETPPYLSVNALSNPKLREQFCRYVRWYETYTGMLVKDYIPEIYTKYIDQTYDIGV